MLPILSNNRWRSSFHFNTNNPRIKLGLHQHHGNLCGILASVQCWIFLHAVLLRPALIPQASSSSSAPLSSVPIPSDEYEETSSTASLSTSSPTSFDEHRHQTFQKIASAIAHPINIHSEDPTDSVPMNLPNRYHDSWCPRYTSQNIHEGFITSLSNIFSPCDCIATSSLIWSICSILYRASPNSRYVVVGLSSKQSELSSDEMFIGRNRDGVHGLIAKIQSR